MSTVKLHRVINTIRAHRPLIVLQTRRDKWTNNYGEIPNLINKADKAPWDLIVPGYPALDVNKLYRATKLEGIILLPNGNHKLIVDVDTDVTRYNDITRDIVSFRDLYHLNTDIYGEIFRYD
jgi:hypothetical protein